MTFELVSMVRWLVGLMAGGMIGAGFGMTQQAARRRYERLQHQGRLRSPWGVMAGSGRRAVYLLMALVLVQMVCPLLFTQGTQWWVSAGVTIGYGVLLFRQKTSGKITTTAEPTPERPAPRRA